LDLGETLAEEAGSILSAERGGTHTMGVYDQEIDQGVLQMDACFGDDWLRWVNLESLNLADCLSCVLGQVARQVLGPTRGYYASFINGDLHQWDRDFCVAMGFIIVDPGDMEYPTLTAEWADRIEKERANRGIMV
jgi:hypothetical protein